MEELNKALEEVILCIKESKEYQKCLKLKEQMNTNQELKELIDNIKKTQKEYIRNNYDETIKEKLNILEERLNAIPIYVIYNQELNKVNDMIEIVKDSLNNYFNKIMNN